VLCVWIVAACLVTAAEGVRRPGDASSDAIRAAAYTIVDLRSHATLEEQRGEWLDAPVWPGSIAKLATFTAAIDAGKLSDHTQILCTRRVTLRDGRHIDCSHAPIASALSIREALAFSCNVFAATVARDLTHAELAAGFTRLGLPAPPPEVDRVAAALGLAGAQVPPRRLLDALVRLVTSDAAHDAARNAPHDAAHDAIDEARATARARVREGLRESARIGTASAFGRAGIDAFAKTGTAPMRGGRPLGLVVALAPADAPRIGIVVALPGGAGADAAEVAAALVRRWQTRQAQAPGQVPPVESVIRVGTPAASRYSVEAVPLEEYVARVVAGETSGATPPAARDALAITARTYALANRGRHAADGFDLCTLTHCQVLRPATAESRAAAERTRGRVLTRYRHDGVPAAVPAVVPVPVFYSAACGGTLEDASVLLPNAHAGSMPWMTSRPDPAGVAEPEWHAELTAVDLLAALHQSGVRGDTLRDLTVRTNATGRVTSISLAGLTPSTLDADDFRRIVGQRLGWQWLKSPRFTAQRTARGYRFDGRGHGHGVGLCVFGAAYLASHGKAADDILRLYFPGLQIVTLNEVTSGTATAAAATESTTTAAPAIELRMPASEEGGREQLRSLIVRSLRELADALHVPAPRRLSVVCHPTGDSYRRATGRPWWTSAATRFDQRGDATVHIVPLDGLRRAGRLDVTIRHELVHVLTAPQLGARPLWVQEGIAAYFAGEHVARDAGVGDEACPADAAFRQARTSQAFEQAYERAAACVAREVARGVSWQTIADPAPTRPSPRRRSP
jgi:stage II sporulation protein D